MKNFICTTDTVEYDYEVANATFHNKLLLSSIVVFVCAFLNRFPFSWGIMHNAFEKS